LLSVQSPKIDSFISKSDKQYFLELKDLLKAVNIPFEEDFTLVRGLDYYN
jgi:histidyl-tRNA synthetase